MSRPKKIHVEARKWKDVKYGNTYHSVLVLADGERFVAGMTYGYGRQWEETAKELLVKAGLLPGLEQYPSGASEMLWRYCQRHGIEYTKAEPEYVKKRELHKTEEDEEEWGMV